MWCDHQCGGRTLQQERKAWSYSRGFPQTASENCLGDTWRVPGKPRTRLAILCKLVSLLRKTRKPGATPRKSSGRQTLHGYKTAALPLKWALAARGQVSGSGPQNQSAYLICTSCKKLEETQQHHAHPSDRLHLRQRQRCGSCSKSAEAGNGDAGALTPAFLPVLGQAV